MTEKELACALFRVYETWWHKIGTYDPGRVLVSDGTTLTDIGGLLTGADLDEMEQACIAVEKHETEIRTWLGL